MNSSFEQFVKNQRNPNNYNSKNGVANISTNKKQVRVNTSTKNKFPNSHINDKQIQKSSYQLINGQTSLSKNGSKQASSKSNVKQVKDSSTQKISKTLSSLLKKNPTVQITKKQRQIREAIEYRYQKSKMKTFKLTKTRKSQKSESIQQFNQQNQEDSLFSQQFLYLKEFKTVDLYSYHRNKHQIYQRFNKINLDNMQQITNQKGELLVIKNKKKRQNSQTFISCDDNRQNKSNLSNKNLIDTSTNGYYPSTNGYYSNKSNISNNQYIKSERNHNEKMSNNQRNKSQSPSTGFKLQFLKDSKAFNKNKSGSRSKILKTQHHQTTLQGIKQKKDKIQYSSSVEKNFKSIKDIYLNALNNLANKNTVKSNKIMKMTNKGSRSLLYASEKKTQQRIFQPKNYQTKNCQSKNHQTKNHQTKHNSTKNDKKKLHNSSSYLLQNNYLACSSSRENHLKPHLHKKPQKPQQQLDKTLLFQQCNPSQWKSIVMKIDQQSTDFELNGLQKKKLKVKTKDEIFSTKLNFNKNKKFIVHPHSHREYTKSPKFKRFVVNQDQEIQKDTKIKNKNFKSVQSVKDFNNSSCDQYANLSYVSLGKDNKAPSRTQNRK